MGSICAITSKGRKKKTSNVDDDEIICMTTATIVMTYEAIGCLSSVQDVGTRLGSKTIKRARKDMPTLFSELGDYTFRRMYRMDRNNFTKLYDLLLPKMGPEENRKRGSTPNGPITHVARLCMALRFCAGGDKYDIAALHGVHFNEIYPSLWRVVDAIHATANLDITYPSSHQNQSTIANDFLRLSKCGFSNCGGCVDGMLVWTHMPSESMDDMGVGPAKFYNGRKKIWP